MPQKVGELSWPLDLLAIGEEDDPPGITDGSSEGSLLEPNRTLERLSLEALGEMRAAKEDIEEREASWGRWCISMAGVVDDVGVGDERKRRGKGGDGEEREAIGKTAPFNLFYFYFYFYLFCISI